jgi:hypothetical protein
MDWHYFLRFYMVLMNYDFNQRQFFKFYYAVKSVPRGLRSTDVRPSRNNVSL